MDIESRGRQAEARDEEEEITIKPQARSYFLLAGVDHMLQILTFSFFLVKPGENEAVRTCTALLLRPECSNGK